MRKLFLMSLLLSLSVCAFAQQDYVGRYDSFVGFSYLDTPKLNLLERGFITEEGVNLNRWLALGVDFSVMQGHSGITPADIKTSVLAQIPAPVLAQLAAIPGYALPYNSTIYTYTAGPQINYRKFKKVTLFVHPDLGAIHATATATPKTPIDVAVLTLLPNLNGGKLKDTTYFYGIGGGAQYHFTKHVGVRFTFDYVHVFLFSGVLANSRNAYRFGIGPSFNFGKNVSK